MDVRCAPLEGLTDHLFRKVHHRCFGGVASYYIPFISPTQHHVFTPKEQRAVFPEYNSGYHAVPQIMTHNADDFLWAAVRLAEMGYDEVNLNAGCPSGTVTAKTKGAGLLRAPDVLRRLLDEICAHSPLPVSVKTRIGFESPDEWELLLDMYRQYPLKELIIHPRTRTQFYKGTPYADCFRAALDCGIPLCYNGDLFTPEDCAALQRLYPGMPMMLGRGLIANPALARQLCGGEGLTVAGIRLFHDLMQEEYRQLLPQSQVHSRMRELMKYISCGFEGAEKARKALRKSTPDNYPEAVERLLSLPLKADAGFDPDAWLH